MTVNRFIRIFAGFMVMLSLGLGVQGSPIFVNQNFLWFTLFVGANLFQSGFTQLCPLATILRKLGMVDPEDPNKSCCN
ncbi:MAG: DUF2892 domain-containing protein [Neisseriaceae bacterium]|jgi:hypothetical protein|nr:MAG: DUF2892 domain-containing protein [Neisseriaceae bacterium]